MPKETTMSGVDYSTKFFTKTFERPEGKFFATFAEEWVPKDQKLNGDLEPTGRYNVCMLHPQYGTVNFFMRQNGNRWSADYSGNEAQGKQKLQLETDVINWCEEAILHQN